MPAFLIPMLGSRIGQIALAFAVGVVAGVFYAFSMIPQVDVAAIERNAIVGRDGYWQAKLNEARSTHAKNLQDAIDARNSTPPAPVTDADVGKLCEQSPTCRDKGPSGGKRLPGLPADNVGKSRLKTDRGSNPRS